MPIETVNLHIVRNCNLRCTYCFGSFPQIRGMRAVDHWLRIIDILHDEGVRRVSFSGGEPTLYPDLRSLLHRAGELGLQTSVITNGARLTPRLCELIDVVGFTLDSAREVTNAALGRRAPSGQSYLHYVQILAVQAVEADCLLKINTVVTQLNHDEDLADVIIGMRPYKWKPLQFVHVVGENDSRAQELAISDEDYAAFVARHHARLEGAGIWCAPEPADIVRSTYVMIDPLGRVFHNRDGRMHLSRPVVEVGLAAAVQDVGGYDRAAFLERGGDVDALQFKGRGWA